MVENPWVLFAAGLLVEHFLKVVGRFIPTPAPLIVKKAEVVQSVQDAVKAKGVVP